MSIVKRGFVVFFAVCMGLVSAGAANAGRSRPVVNPNLSQQAKLTASDAVARDFFGHAVAISSDGNFAVVGAWGRTKGTGAAFTFANSGGVWTQQAKLGPSDLVVGDQFGSSVAISSDGTTAVVGAESKNVGLGMSSHDVNGAVYVFTRSGSTWTQQAKLTASDSVSGLRFGSAVSLSGDGNTLLVGARGNASSVPAGAAYTFTRSGSTWTQQQKLTASDAATGDYFGTSAALSADGLTAVVGAPAKNSYTGASYVFTVSGGVWSQQAELTAGDAAANDSFGTSVAVNGDGTTAIMGASGKDSYKGAGYVFVLSGGVWSQQAKLSAGNGVAGDAFGGHVAVSSNGSIAVLSASGKLNNAGSIYEFTRAGSVWSQAAEQTSDTDTDGDTVGSSVSITATGATMLVGAEGVTKFTGAAYVFTADVSPVISGFTPNAGKPCDPVTISGVRFTGATNVTFNGAQAVFTVDSDIQITATVPSDGTTGPISVTTPDGSATSAKNFKVKPDVQFFNPLQGTIGDPVTISGAGFLGTTDVQFNGVSATFTVVDSGTITTNVPAGATSGKISVTNAGGTSKSPTSFHVT
jgi:FG-GAP repeat/IPT/TIG domain